MTAPSTARKPQDRKPRQASSEKPDRPAGWELLKPLDQVPVWEQTELMAIAKPLMSQLQLPSTAADVEVWRKYAADHEVDVEPGATRDAVIEAVQKAARDQKITIDFESIDFRVVGDLAKALTSYAVDEDAYLAFVSGEGALVRAMELGSAYVGQLGE